MKICFFGLQLTYKGGVENLSVNLIKHLAQNSNVDEIFVVCDSIEEETYKSLPHKKVHVQCVGRTRKSDVIRVLLRNVKYRRLSNESGKFDVFHTLDCRAFSAFNFNVRPSVVTIHDVMFNEVPIVLKTGGFARIDGLWHLIRMVDHYSPQLILEFFSAVKANRIVVSTPLVAEQLKKLYGHRVKGKIRVIPPGFDQTKFNPYFMSKTDAKRFLKLHSSSKMLLHVGGCAPRKGFPHIMHALAYIHKIGLLDNPHTFLFVLGKVDKRYLSLFPPLRDHIVELEYLNENELPIVYRAADAFVFPSIREGWGIALIQALACGTPVVTSQHVPSALATKDTGMVFIEPTIDNPTELAKSILKALDDASCVVTDWDRIFDSLVLKYSWKNVSERQLRVYQELM